MTNLVRKFERTAQLWRESWLENYKGYSCISLEFKFSSVIFILIVFDHIIKYMRMFHLQDLLE